MFFDEPYDWHGGDHPPLVRFLQHAPKSAQGIVSVGWRTADNERGDVVFSDVIQLPACHARFLQQFPTCLQHSLPSERLVGVPECDSVQIFVRFEPLNDPAALGIIGRV